MAYQIKRKKHVVKQIELLNEEGKPERTLSVDIIVDDFRNRYPQVLADIEKAQQMLKDKGDNDAEAIAASQIAVKAFFVLIFGQIQTRSLLEYYENRYYEGFLDIIPFVMDEIMPEVNKAVEEENARISSIMK
jgi:hypothetical protein